MDKKQKIIEKWKGNICILKDNLSEEEEEINEEEKKSRNIFFSSPQ